MRPTDPIPNPPPTRPEGTPFRELVDFVAATLPERSGRNALEEDRRRVARAFAAATMSLVPPRPRTPFAPSNPKMFSQKLNSFTSNARWLLDVYETQLRVHIESVDSVVAAKAKEHGFAYGLDLSSIKDDDVRDQLYALRHVELAFLDRAGFSRRFWRVVDESRVVPRGDGANGLDSEQAGIAWSELPDDGLDWIHRWFLNIDGLGKDDAASAFVVHRFLAMMEVALGERSRERDLGDAFTRARAAAKKSLKRRRPYQPRFESFAEALSAAEIYDALDASFPRDLVARTERRTSSLENRR